MPDKEPSLEVKIEKLGVSLSKQIDELSRNLEAKIDRQLSFIRYWGVGGIATFCLVFSWLFDHKFDFVDNRNQAHFEKLDAAVFVSKHDAILRALHDLRTRIDDKREGSGERDRGGRRRRR